jgi:predicted solute-binding protein
VIQRHIELYVNDYTLDLDADAVRRLIALDDRNGDDPAARPVFAYA